MNALSKHRIQPNAGIWLLATGGRALMIIALVFLLALGCDLSLMSALGQPPQCDPAKVTGPLRCAKCHENEVRVWQQTRHAKTFEELHRKAEANAIANKMGLRSIKRGDVCWDCHYTSQVEAGRTHIIAGVSCESCHGAAKDWVELHNDYGGPTAIKSQETPAHQTQRRADSIAAGMRNPTNIYLVARSCFQCHTVPNEALVNVGGHKAGSLDFELVTWSQGINRHNFLRTNNTANAENSPERIRVMFVAGLIADLEFSTRATALATEKSQYGLTVANRAVTAAVKLKAIQDQIKNPDLERVLQAFSQAVLKTNNQAQLLPIADQIQQAGIDFATHTSGETLVVIDPQIPDRSRYK